MIKIDLTKAVLITLLLIGGMFFLTSYFINEQKKDIVADITLSITEQEKTLSNIAEITDRNGADSVVESIVQDCSNRARFESLLNSLAELTPAELSELRTLFDGCASFFSDRKAMMVSRMVREYEVFENLVQLLSVVDDSIAIAEYQLPKWTQLVEFEKKRSEIFTDQVELQLNIIVALQNGEPIGSDSMNKMLTEATNINEQAGVVNRQIDALRASLLDL